MILSDSFKIMWLLLAFPSGKVSASVSHETGYSHSDMQQLQERNALLEDTIRSLMGAVDHSKCLSGSSLLEN